MKDKKLDKDKHLHNLHKLPFYNVIPNDKTWNSMRESNMLPPQTKGTVGGRLIVMVWNLPICKRVFWGFIKSFIRN